MELNRKKKSVDYILESHQCVDVIFYLSLNSFLLHPYLTSFYISLTATSIPKCYRAVIIHGFVEELVVNEDPEYQWIDRIRTPRASNEARQRLISLMSGIKLAGCNGYCCFVKEVTIQISDLVLRQGCIIIFGINCLFFQFTLSHVSEGSLVLTDDERDRKSTPPLLVMPYCYVICWLFLARLKKNGTPLKMFFNHMKTISRTLSLLKIA